MIAGQESESPSDVETRIELGIEIVVDFVNLRILPTCDNDVPRVVKIMLWMRKQNTLILT